MSVTAAPSAPRPLARPHSGLAVAWRGLRGFKILLPFAVLVAIWWAIKASGDFPDNVLVSPLRPGTPSFTSPPTACWRNMPAPA